MVSTLLDTKNMKKLMTMTALGVVLACSNANASGFFLKEQSAAAQGNAFAGATAGAEDISYSFFNPATLSRHKGTKINLGGTWISPRSTGRNAVNQFGETDGYIDNIVHAAMTPQFYASHQIDDKFTAGISVNVPYGMITKYDDAWAGRFHGTMSKVTTATVTPMLSYKANDKLSIGAGMQMQYVKARLRNGVLLGVHPVAGIIEDKAALEGDAFDVGYQLGGLYEFNPQTRIGVGYRSEIRHKLKGDVSFAGIASPMSQDISARLTTPASLSVGAYHDINDKWAVMAEYSRVFWSSFDKLDIIGEKNPNLSYTEEKWRDTNFYAIGASYQMDHQWKLRGGIAFDKTAVGEEHRTPRIPDASRIWYSAGLEYKYNDKMTFNLGYTYIQADKSNVALRGDHKGDTSRGSLNVNYENRVNIVALSLNYNF